MRYLPSVVFCGLFVATSSPAQQPAPEPDAQAIVLAAAPWIIRWTELEFPLGSDRLLAPEFGSYYLNGTQVLTHDWGKRSTKEVQELAAALRAGLGTAADSVWCVNKAKGPCHGTTKVLVRIGMPIRNNDTAVVNLSGETRYDESVSVTPSGSYWSIALVLQRVKGEWNTVGYRQVFASASQIQPIDSLLVRRPPPVSRGRGGRGRLPRSPGFLPASKSY